MWMLSLDSSAVCTPAQCCSSLDTSSAIGRSRLARIRGVTGGGWGKESLMGTALAATRLTSRSLGQSAHSNLRRRHGLPSQSTHANSPLPLIQADSIRHAPTLPIQPCIPPPQPLTCTPEQHFEERVFPHFHHLRQRVLVLRQELDVQAVGLHGVRAAGVGCGAGASPSITAALLTRLLQQSGRKVTFPPPSPAPQRPSIQGSPPPRRNLCLRQGLDMCVCGSRHGLRKRLRVAVVGQGSRRGVVDLAARRRERDVHGVHAGLAELGVLLVGVVWPAKAVHQHLRQRSVRRHSCHAAAKRAKPLALTELVREPASAHQQQPKNRKGGLE